MTLSDKDKYVSLVTIRRDGRPVATPVWFAATGDDFGVITETDAGKVKRIRNNPRVTVQVCDMKGAVSASAPLLQATARLVTSDEAGRVRKAIARKYGLVYAMFTVYWSISKLLARLRGNHNRDREVAILFRLDG
jgi:PPOX class probable F420-dependent enzyme